MSLLTKTVEQIEPLDTAAMAAVQNRLDSLTKPQGSLGRLEEMARHYAGITGELHPAVPAKCVLLFAADHGVAQQGISAYPVETTVHMTRNYLVARGAGANALANFCGAELIVVDVGIGGDTDAIPGLYRRKIARGTEDFTLGPAMSRKQAMAAVETGIAIVNELLDKGCRCFCLGEMGIGNTTASSAIAAAFSGISPEKVTGRGTGISDKRLEVKINAVRTALAVNQPDIRDGIDVLAKIGGFEIGALAGAMLGAAAGKAVVILDGINASAAALIAQAIAPLSTRCMMASHLSAEPAHAKMLEMLGVVPCIDLGLRLGEATGASLAADLLDASLKMLNEMATFAEAGVSDGKGPEQGAAS